MCLHADMHAVSATLRCRHKPCSMNQDSEYHSTVLYKLHSWQCRVFQATSWLLLHNTRTQIPSALTSIATQMGQCYQQGHHCSSSCKSRILACAGKSITKHRQLTCWSVQLVIMPSYSQFLHSPRTCTHMHMQIFIPGKLNKLQSEMN